MATINTKATPYARVSARFPRVLSIAAIVAVVLLLLVVLLATLLAISRSFHFNSLKVSVLKCPRLLRGLEAGIGTTSAMPPKVANLQRRAPPRLEHARILSINSIWFDMYGIASSVPWCEKEARPPMHLSTGRREILKLGRRLKSRWKEDQDMWKKDQLA